MSVKDIKNVVICSIGALILVSLGYFIFNNLPNITLNLNGILDFVEAVSWKSVAFIVCFTLLCMECLLVKYKTNKIVVEKLLTGIVILLICANIFAALAYLSNHTLFNQSALGFIGAAIIASAFATTLIYHWDKIEKPEKLLLLGGVIFSVVVMWPIMTCNELPKNDAITTVVNKYYQQFNALGFTNVEFNTQYRENGVKYDKKRKSGEKYVMISNGDVKEALNIEENKYDYDNRYYNKYSNIRLFIKQEKLYIENIDYNPKNISKEALAKELDVIMEKVIMPKLQNLNSVLLQEEANQQSYN